MIKLNKNNIAVVPIAEPDQTEGGIWIPDMAKKRANQGVVKYIGSNVKDINVGDYVLFSGYTGTTVLVGNERLIIMNHEFVNARMEMAEHLIVPGLYGMFKDKDGFEEFFPMTYEAAVPLLRLALEDYSKKLKVISDKPKVEDYNKK